MFGQVELPEKKGINTYLNLGTFGWVNWMTIYRYKL